MAYGIAYPTLSPSVLAQRWREVTKDATAPDYCELDEYGDLIVTNPPTRVRQRIVWAVQQQIANKLGGEALPGIGVLTRIGVRTPDICWRREPTSDDPAFPAPEICVEVQSESNTRRELDSKVAAYLEAGCREVVLIELGGQIRYFGSEGERATSAYGLELRLPEGTYPQ